MVTTPLHRRALGTSGLEITTVGFGAWAIGGGGWAFSWGPQDDATSIATMRHALDNGINWIDTAAVYGLGHSEEIIGRLLRELPAAERPLVFTKCGLRWEEAKPMESARRILTPASIGRECEASLRRLGVERIDLYQCHWPDESEARLEESWAAMGQLVRDGKVRAVGVSNFDLTQLARCEAIRHVDALQPPLSAVRRDAGDALIPWCAQHGTGVIGYSPLQSAILTDSFTTERVAQMAPDDWRTRGVQFQEPNLSRSLALRDALRPIAARHDVSVAAVAVAWVLAWSGVSGAIVGARTPAQVDDWISAGRLTLAPADLDEIALAITRSGAGSGPARPAGSRPARAAAAGPRSA